MHDHRRRCHLFHSPSGQWFTIFLLLIAAGCSRTPNPGADSGKKAPETGRVSFVQWSDPHVFDAGASRQGEGIEEEQLDNWSSLHFAVMQTNRLVLEEHRAIDFVMITGDFGLYNVKMDLPDLKDKNGKVQQHDENCQHDPKEGPGVPVSMDEATQLVARELRALVVKKVYLVPGNNDLCDEDPRNRYRYAEFILRLKQTVRRQQDERKDNLKAAAQSVVADQKAKGAKSPSSSLPVDPPPGPEIIDLTFTLEKLARAKSPDLRAASLLEKLSTDEQAKYVQGTPGGPGYCSSKTAGDAPAVNGFCLLGLDSSYFKLHDDPLSIARGIPAAADQASVEAMDRLSSQVQTGGSYLLFTHVPDIEDPFPGRKADPGSSWKVSDPVRDKWKDTLKRNELIAVFAGHFHSGNREIYPHNFSYVKSLDPLVAQKFWLSPSLAAKYQAKLPAPKTARGIFLFTVTKKGGGGVAPTGGGEVEALPVWFSPLDQKPPMPAEDKFAAARADENDGKWDEAAKKYQELMGNAALDSSTRSVALAGYAHSRERMDQWWWKSPLARWFYLHGEAALYTLALLVGLVLVYWLLSVTRIARGLLAVTKAILLPRFRGKAKLNATAKITKEAPSEEFAGQMLVAAEEIRRLLQDEQEPFMAQHITLLTPSSSSIATLVDSAPKVKGVEEVGSWLKFFSSLMQTFQWNIDSGVAVFPPDPIPAAGAATPPLIQEGGKISGYAVLQWGWFLKDSWLRSVPVVDHSALSDVARQLAELVAGEAFLRSGDRRFTKAESFCLFMEGVRWLQLYDEEANQEQPSQPLLKQRLLQAQKFLRECVTTYPNDLLPRYYLGIIFTYHAQVEQALYFQDLLTRGALTIATLLTLPPKEEIYLKRAAKEFAAVAQRAQGDLQWYALYNRAQALARLDEN